MAFRLVVHSKEATVDLPSAQFIVEDFCGGACLAKYEAVCRAAGIERDYHGRHCPHCSRYDCGGRCLEACRARWGDQVFRGFPGPPVLSDQERTP